MIKAKVVSKEILTKDIVQLRLTPNHWEDWQPGAHLDITLPNGMERQYSLVPCDNGQYAIAVLKESDSRGGSLCIHDDVQVGTELQLSAPKSKFSLQQDGRAILMSAGIGITPLMSIADALHAANIPLDFRYAFRAPDQAAYLNWLATRPWADACQQHISSEGTRLDIAKTLQDLQPDAHVYACGPSAFLEPIEAAMSAQNCLDRLHVEYFSNKELELSGSDFIVHLAQSGGEVKVGEQETILTALQREGYDPMYSCEDGVCGSCILPLVEGEAEHRDKFLTDEEQASQSELAICCSRAKNNSITIDF